MAGAEDSQRITDLQTTMTQIRLQYAALLDQITEIERRQTAKKVGYKDTRALLVDALRVAPRDATRMVTQSGLVAETLTPTGHVTPAPLPVVRVVLHEGVLDPEHITAIADTVQQVPDWVDLQTRTLVEATLVETARTHSPRAVRKHGDTLLARLDQDGTNPSVAEREAEPHNWFRSQRDRSGRMTFRGELEPETAELFEAVLTDLAQPQPLAKDLPDPRSTEERYGDAMAELVYRAAYPHGTQQPALAVHLDLNVLLEGIGTATLDSGCPLSAGAVRRLSCDAGLIPIVLNGTSVPLDVGRAHRLVTPEQRRALVARDRCCAYPGCDLAARWCEAHHIKPWSEGGNTDLANLVLLCRRHHRMIHHPEWTIQVHEELPQFLPPKWIDPHQRPMRNIIRQ